MRIGRHKALLLLLPALSLAGCTTPPFCEALNKCGGDFTAGAKDHGGPAPSTKWTAIQGDGCVDQVPNPPSPPSAALVPPRPAGVRAIEPSTLDWCAGLIISGDGTVQFDDGWFETLKKYNGWFPSVPLYSAELELMTNNQYAVSTTQLASQHYELTPQCLVAQGVTLQCSALGTALKTSVEATLGSVDALKTPAGSDKKAFVYTIPEGAPLCSATTDGGCVCDYNVSLTTHTTGPMSFGTVTPGEINFFDAQAAPPVATDYCVSASGLTLSGAKEADLFNRASLKTLKLRPAP